jgi:hypothetical protein
MPKKKNGQAVSEVDPSFGPQMDIPNRAERKALLKEMAEAAKKGLREDAPGAGEYAVYAEKMQALDEQMDELSALDEWGIPKPLTAEQKAALAAAMEETALAGEAYLTEAKKAAGQEQEPKQGLPGLVGKLQGVLSHDYAAVQAYDPASKLSLPEVMEKSRCKTIQLGTTQIDSMGGAQSSRIPMSLVNEKGEKRQGFLTKANTIELKKTYEAGLQAASKYLDDEANEQLGKLLENHRKLRKIPADKSDEYVIADMFGCFYHKDRPVNLRNLGFMLGKLGVKTTINQRAAQAMIKAWEPLNKVSTYFNGRELGLKDGERVDRRNSGMSAVAEVLGKPNILSRSTDVKFTDGKGKVVEGTFMDYAQGLDLNSKHKDHYQRIADDPFTGSSKPGAFFKQVSDLQVVDFLCGNIDRHSANLTYIVDDKGKLIGVQGIDNDSSLGCNAPGEKSQQRLPGTANMGVISKSMADKITGMNAAMLKFALRGKGLTEEQLDCAALRLGQLQEAIRKGEEHYKNRDLAADLKKKKEKTECQAYDEGFLRTVPDEDFAKLKLRHLCPTEPVNKMGWQKNLFGEIRYWIPGLIRDARKEGINFVPKDKREEKAPELTEVDTTGKTLKEKLGVRNIQDSITGISNLVNIRDREKFGDRQHVDELTEGKRTSRQFTALVKEVKALEAMQKYFHKINASGLPLTGQEYRQYYEKVQASLNSIEEKKRLYMENKMRQRKVTEEKDLRGKNDYEQRRIDYVKNVGKYVNKAKFRFGNLTPPDELLKDQEEVRAQAEQRDLDDRKAAKKALDELLASKGLGSAEALRTAQRGGDAPEDAELRDKFAAEQQKAAEELKKQQEPQGPVL